MPGVEVFDVDSHVEIADAEVRVTDIEVTRSIGTSANHAKVMGIVDDIDNLELNQQVTVHVNGESIFSGALKRAVQDEEGIVTMDVYGPLIDFYNKKVILNSEEQREAYWVLQDILFDADYTPAITYENAPDDPKPLYLDPQEDLVSGGATVVTEYGSGDRGQPLGQVVDDLATKLHADVWVDKNGVIRIESYPPHRRYEARYITELEAGEDTNNTQRVVVKGGSPVGDLGPAASHMYSQTNHTSVAEREDMDEDDGKERTISDQNVITQNAANSTASSEMYRSTRRSNPGTLKVIGNVDIELFDVIEVPQLEDTRPLSDNAYVIKEVQHVINSQDGFITTVTLSDEPTNIMESLTGPAGDLGSLFAQRIREQEIYAGIMQPVIGFTESSVGLAEEILQEIEE